MPIRHLLQKVRVPAKDGRSELQRQGSAAMTRVMQAWEGLTDMERLAWDVQGKQRRMSGVNHFKKVNLRRLLRGEEMIRVPPLSKPYDPRPLLKGLDIRNRRGRITLELELWRVPDAPRTVWASLPNNRGAKQPRHCPRLGWLPAPQGRWSEISKLYFKRHGNDIKEHRLELVGKRIFVRLRPETDDGSNLYEQVGAVVPRPEVQMGKKDLRPSKDLRIPFEAPSKPLRNITRTTSRQQALRTPWGGGRRRRGRGYPEPGGRSPK